MLKAIYSRGENIEHRSISRSISSRASKSVAKVAHGPRRGVRTGLRHPPSSRSVFGPVGESLEIRACARDLLTGFNKRQSQLVPALVAPIHSVDGEIVGYRDQAPASVTAC